MRDPDHRHGVVEAEARQVGAGRSSSLNWAGRCSSRISNTRPSRCSSSSKERTSGNEMKNYSREPCHLSVDTGNLHHLRSVLRATRWIGLRARPGRPFLPPPLQMIRRPLWLSPRRARLRVGESPNADAATEAASPRADLDQLRDCFASKWPSTRTRCSKERLAIGRVATKLIAESNGREVRRSRLGRPPHTE